MSQYLEEAAALLRKVVETSEQGNRGYPSLLAKDRERIAMKFAQLAAIDRGLIPTEMVGDVLAHLVRQN